MTKKLNYLTIILLPLLLISCNKTSKETTTNTQQVVTPTKTDNSTYKIPEKTQNHPIVLKIKALITSAKNGDINDVTFHTAGDSKRDGVASMDKINYARAFGKLGITYKHHAVSSITTAQWINGNPHTNPKTESKLSELKQDATGDQGAHSIVEFSLGTNDLNTYKVKHVSNGKFPPVDAQKKFLKAELLKGIEAIQKALPNALLFVAEATGIEDPVLKETLAIVAKEKDLPLIKAPLDYEKYQNLQSKFFVDNHHPSVFGSYKIIQNTLRHLTEGEARSTIKYNTLYVTPPADKLNSNLAHGIPIDHSVRIYDEIRIDKGEPFRSITLDVVGGAMLKIKHPGSYNRVVFLDDENLGILKKSIGQPSERGSQALLSPQRLLNDINKTTGVKYIHIPKETKKIVINLENENGATFDEKILTSPIEVYYMSKDEINTYHPSLKEMEADLPQ
ncbi:MAG: hypothetical protein L3J43_10610 [Sulfurovum sp.]|nr:hypothetical protein [Sulfurovum sp.]